MNYNSGINEAKEEGRALGIQEGERKKQEIAKKLLAKKIPIEEIKDITSLSEKDIQKIKDET